MLSATFRALQSSGYLKGEERIDRGKIARDCMAMLMERPVDQSSPDEIDQKAMIAPEFRVRLVSDNGYGEDVEKELDTLIGQIVAGDGAVQQLLGLQVGDKYVLCGKRVTRQMIGVDGQVTMTLKRAGKFISRDPDVIEKYYYQEAVSRFERSTETVKRRLETAEERQPALVARREALSIKAREHVQLALPVGGDAQP